MRFLPLAGSIGVVELGAEVGPTTLSADIGMKDAPVTVPLRCFFLTGSSGAGSGAHGGICEPDASVS